MQTDSQTTGTQTTGTQTTGTTADEGATIDLRDARGSDASGADDRRDDRGRRAESPSELTAAGWKDVLFRVKDEVKDDRVALLSAGVAFFLLLAMVPAFAALVSIYGLVADPADIATQVEDYTTALPESARTLITEQLQSVASSAGGGVTLGVVFGLGFALWSASSGIKHLIEALNAAYDETESRGFLAIRGRALAMTLGGVVFAVVALGVVTALPAVLRATGLGVVGRLAANVGGYVALAAGFGLGLSVLYRFGPDRDAPQWKWVTPGALAATALWIAASLGFSVYIANFGSYSETYGSIGAVIVLMLWLMITAFSVVLGAEFDSELEAQTRHDTTVGRPEPMGDRDAVKADVLGDTHG